MTSEKVYQMKLAKVYPLLVAKAERKGRTRAEVDEVARWLTGYSQEALEECLEKKFPMEISFGMLHSQIPTGSLLREASAGSRCRR